MKIKDLVNYVSEKEGLKSKAKEGDIREIIRILSDIVYAQSLGLNCINRCENEAVYALYSNGKRRSKANKKK